MITALLWLLGGYLFLLQMLATNATTSVIRISNAITSDISILLTSFAGGRFDRLPLSAIRLDLSIS
jgi:hypothetical protein